MFHIGDVAYVSLAGGCGPAAACIEYASAFDRADFITLAANSFGPEEALISNALANDMNDQAYDEDFDDDEEDDEEDDDEAEDDAAY